ncbi:PAS domain-containing sensor histidine kinase [Azotobacter vinelandii]|uniref:PAS domain-containing sensor histidine kinase n=1 Tax=Azotobacter vinelandii TaxID=354 RepID=UPI0007748C90|nr:PAS domain-containing sensor histidine kinase [Azotobacter vinelandii]
MDNNKEPAPTNDETDSIRPPYQALIEQSLVGIYILQDNRLKYSNNAFAQLNGYKIEDFVGRSLHDFLDRNHLMQVMRNIHTRIAQGGSMRYKVCARKSDGQPIYLEVHGSYTELEGRPAVAGVAIDITDRHNYEQELRNSREQLRILARHSNKLAEQLRARIAREIHDVLGGVLTSIKLDTNRLKQRADNPETLEIIESILGLSQEGIDMVREISEQLYPAVLDHLGLDAALRNDFERFCRRTGLNGDFHTSCTALNLGGSKSLAVYRIFQEALTNIAKHAQAEIVTVDVGLDRQLFHMEIKDDGQGLHANFPREGSLGLLSMKERAAEVGGMLEIGGTARGTRLHLQIPLQEDKA